MQCANDGPRTCEAPPPARQGSALSRRQLLHRPPFGAVLHFGGVFVNELVVQAPSLRGEGRERVPFRSYLPEPQERLDGWVRAELAYEGRSKEYNRGSCVLASE